MYLFVSSQSYRWFSFSFCAGDYASQRTTPLPLPEDRWHQKSGKSVILGYVHVDTTGCGAVQGVWGFTGNYAQVFVLVWACATVNLLQVKANSSLLLLCFFFCFFFVF